MAQGVEAGEDGLAGRQGLGEPGVLDGVGRVEVGRVQGGLVLAVGLGHGETVAFRARAVGGVDGDHGQGAADGHAFFVEIRSLAHGMAQQCRRGLGRVDGAAAADAEHGLGAQGLADLGRRLAVGIGGVGPHAVVMLEGHPARQHGQHRIPGSAGLVGHGVGDHEDAVLAGRGQVGQDAVEAGEGSRAEIGRRPGGLQDEHLVDVDLGFPAAHDAPPGFRFGQAANRPTPAWEHQFPCHIVLYIIPVN